jgi:hypothetical protein
VKVNGEIVDDDAVQKFKDALRRKQAAQMQQSAEIHFTLENGRNSELEEVLNGRVRNSNKGKHTSS